MSAVENDVKQPATAVRQELDADGILTLTMDMPGRSMNVLNEELTSPFASALERIESDAAVKGVIITSGKKEFLAGADIEKVYAITDPAEAFALSTEYQAFLRRLETCGKPVVAALNGTALGGGLELALACHYRVAVNNPKAKFGLPEVKLGLLPGGGGTQRLPRLIGIQNSLPLMLEGKELSAEKAKGGGIIHALAADIDDMLKQAKEWCVANPKATAPWDAKGFRWPGGDAKHPGNVQMLAIAPSMLNQKTFGNYPAPRNILSCVVEGGLVDIDTGLKIEARYFAELVVSQVSKNMINTFWFQLNALNKGESRPQGFEKSQVKKVGILGAGMMGAGIAYVSAKVGIEVVLKDVSQEAANKGKAYSENLLTKAIQRGRSTNSQKEEILARIKATDQVEDLAGCDLIIEAVFEDRDLKATVTKETEAVMDPTGVFGSNTSTLPITGLAEASVRKEQFIGIHFFSPVDKMPLVEIIVGEQTSDATLARAFDYVQQIKKTPIVVNDSRGFYTSRCFGTYVNEGVALLAEGQHPRAIEQAGLMSGMPVGPLALQDEVSLSLALHVMTQSRKDMGDAYKEPASEKTLRKMVEELGREGKKNGKGFYDYPPADDRKAKKKLWPGLAEHFPLAEQQLSVAEMRDRFLFAQANETARCVEEGVVEKTGDANIGSIFGWGFAPWAGGTLQFINATGVGSFVERARELAGKYGERFEPAAILVKMAETGQTFN